MVDVTPKALDILCLLIESDGRLVSKEEIISRVWPDSYVEEANLSHHIFRLRRALGEGEGAKYIETISKRGYRFVAPIKAKAFPTDEIIDPVVSASPIPVPRSASARTRIAVLTVSSLLLLAIGVYFTVGRSWIKASGPVVNTANAANPSMSIDPVTTAGDRGSSTISPNGKFIAYAQIHASGEGVLYLRQTDTNAEIKLLEGGERRFGSIAFSPDNVFLYYVLMPKGEVQSLYRIPVLGGQPTRISTDLNYFFTLSGDGAHAAFYRSDKTLRQTSIILVALDGSGAERALKTFDDQKQSPDSVPALSPDGKTIIFGLADAPDAVDKAPARVELHSLTVADGSTRVLSSEKWMGIGMMNWMPDASGAVFVGYRLGALNQIHYVSFPDGQLRAITNELSGYSHYGLGITADGKMMVAEVIEFASQLWTSSSNGKTRDGVQLTTAAQDGGQGLVSLPDGEILYTSRSGADYDIWSLKKKGTASEAFPLTDLSSNEVEPVASPDGRYFVFVSDRTGTRHLYRSEIDGSNHTQLTFGDGIDRNPDLTPDGNWIIYASSLNSEKRIWKLPVTGGSPVQINDLECVAPKVSPDGKSFVCVRPAAVESARGKLEIVSLDDGKQISTIGEVPFDWYFIPPKWTPDGRAIVYRRTDTPIGNLWKQDLTGGEPQQFTDFTSLKMYNFAFSRDGQNLITARGTIKVNVVMLKNFL